MANFAVWSVHHGNDGRIAIDVTRANLPKVWKGTKNLILASLNSMNISSSILDWEVHPFRSFFYSDYPDDENWEDNWREGWTFELRLSIEAEPVDNILAAPPRMIDELDDTWEFGYSTPVSEQRALILLGSRESDEIAKQTIEQLLSEREWSWMRSHIENTSTIRYIDGYVATRIVLAGGMFPKYAAQMLSSLRHARRKGWLINWQSLL